MSNDFNIETFAVQSLSASHKEQLLEIDKFLKDGVKENRLEIVTCFKRSIEKEFDKCY